MCFMSVFVNVCYYFSDLSSPFFPYFFFVFSSVSFLFLFVPLFPFLFGVIFFIFFSFLPHPSKVYIDLASPGRDVGSSRFRVEGPRICLITRTTDNPIYLAVHAFTTKHPIKFLSSIYSK